MLDAGTSCCGIIITYLCGLIVVDALHLLVLADSLFNSFNFDQALELVNQAVQMDPSSVAFTKRGDAHLRLNQLDLALKDFDQAITADRKNPLALYFRGMVLMRHRKPEEATQDFEQVITVDSGCGFGHLGLGIIRAVNNKSQATESLSRADELLSIQLAQDPDNAWLLLRRAQACRFLALLTPSSSSVFAWFGVRTRGKLLEKAAADLDRALMLKPSFLEAIIERGLVRVAAGRFEPGYHDLKSAIAIMPASTFRLGANEIIVRGSNRLSTSRARHRQLRASGNERHSTFGRQRPSFNKFADRAAAKCCVSFARYGFFCLSLEYYSRF